MRGIDGGSQCTVRGIDGGSHCTVRGIDGGSRRKVELLMVVYSVQ